MARRARPEKREVKPDSVYQSITVTRFLAKVMRDGKKSTAERIIYGAIKTIEDKGQNGLNVMEQAVKNATPLLQVKPRRVGGATYQVPVEVPADRGLSLALRWLVQSSRARSGKSMAEKLAAELMDASQNQGATAKKREDVHKMAEANRAFAHYRW